jgi:hypothetical protein
MRTMADDPIFIRFATTNSENSSAVEHNLAKVGVAGSNPVSRSSPGISGRVLRTLALFSSDPFDPKVPGWWNW